MNSKQLAFNFNSWFYLRRKKERLNLRGVSQPSPTQGWNCFCSKALFESQVPQKINRDRICILLLNTLRLNCETVSRLLPRADPAALRIQKQPSCLMQLGLLLLPREVPEKVLGHYTQFPVPGYGPWGSIYSPAVFLTAVQSVASKIHQAHSLPAFHLSLLPKPSHVSFMLTPLLLCRHARL